MKKILLAISMVLALSACIRENFPQEVDTDGEMVLDFNVVVPEGMAVTRSFSDPAVESITVLMFDQYGYFLAAEDAQTVSGNKFKVTLPQHPASCTLHFVANCPKSAADFTPASETEIMTSLVTTGDNDAYWQSITLGSLLEVDKASIKTALTNIQMVRNYAKISLAMSDKIKNFTLKGYRLLNTPTSGTVVPYNTTYGRFEHLYGPKGEGLDYIDLKTRGYNGFMPVEYGIDDTVTEPTEDLESWTLGMPENQGGYYTYEKAFIPDDTHPLSILIWGEYNSIPCFYKAEVYNVDNPYNSGNYDILRNIHYQVTITGVLGLGYDTAEAASMAVAGNNISNSTLTSSLINISDGFSRLLVEYNVKRLVREEEFTLKYKFIPDISGEEYQGVNNNIAEDLESVSESAPLIVELKITSDDSNAIIDTWEVIDEDGDGCPDVDEKGWSTIIFNTVSDLPDKNTVWSEEFIISGYYTNQDGYTVRLNRSLKLYMHSPYDLEVSCTPDEVASNASGQPVTLYMEIPSSLPEDIFPLNFLVESDKMTISPDAHALNILGEQVRMPVWTDQTIIPGNDLTGYYYERPLTYDEYTAIVAANPGAYVTVPTHFLTNIKESTTDIYVYNEFFGEVVNTGFTAVAKEEFTDIEISETLRRYGEGQTGTLSFTAPSYAPVTITLAGVQSAGKSTLTVSGSTSYEIPLTTTDWGTLINVRLESEDCAIANVSKEHNLLHFPAGIFKVDPDIAGYSLNDSRGNGKVYGYDTSCILFGIFTFSTEGKLYYNDEFSFPVNNLRPNTQLYIEDLYYSQYYRHYFTAQDIVNEVPQTVIWILQ